MKGTCIEGQHVDYSHGCYDRPILIWRQDGSTVPLDHPAESQDHLWSRGPDCALVF